MNIIGTIEIPKNSNHKYEVDKTTGQLVLDRIIDYHYPANYGFIPNTLSEDGDELDVFVYSETPIQPLAKVKLEVLGAIELTDNGVKDNKIICRIQGAQHPVDSTFGQIVYFLRQYKSGIIIKGITDKIKAEELIKECSK